MRPSNWKLCPEDIERIREQQLFGARNCDQARAWGVSPSSMHAVRSQRTFQPFVYPLSPMFEALQQFYLAPAP